MIGNKKSYKNTEDKNIFFIKAPAKINLYLNILNKRADGYHNIQTIFEKINIYDKIFIEKRQDANIEIDCNNLSINKIDNIAYKAAKLFLAYLNNNTGFNIKIEKNIPVGAGLGGGSSDAASVILGIKQLLGVKLTQQELWNIGIKLGADVPFFLSGASIAYGEGRPDSLTKIDLEHIFWHILINPGVYIATEEAYFLYSRKIKNDLTKPYDNIKMLVSYVKNYNLDKIYYNIYNSFQTLICKQYAEVDKAITVLNRLGLNGKLSGSGSTVFALTPDEYTANKIKSKILDIYSRENWQVEVVSTFVEKAQNL